MCFFFGHYKTKLIFLKINAFCKQKLGKSFLKFQAELFEFLFTGPNFNISRKNPGRSNTPNLI